MQEVQRMRMKRTRRPRKGAMNMEGELMLILYMLCYHYRTSVRSGQILS